MVNKCQTDKFSERLARLRAEYLENLKQTVAVVEELREKMLIETSLESVFDELMPIVHKLVGSGKTFGLPSISDSAKNLESLLGTKREINKASVLPNNFQKIIIATDALIYICRKNINYSDLGIQQETSLATPISLEEESRVILMVGKESDDIKELVIQLSYIGLEIHLIQNLEELEIAADNYKPTLIAIVTDFTDTEVLRVQDFLSARGAKKESIPILYLSLKNDFETRLTAVRLEGLGFLSLPTDSIKLLDQYRLLTRKNYSRNYHVLIIDEDQTLAKRYALTLESVGIQVSILSNPNGALNLLNEKTIDLVLLDFHMAECNGFEVARILRQLDRYVSLPIIFLSTEMNLNKMMRSSYLGIDDFLTKPIVDDDLISIVLRRAERSLILRKLIDQDSATGLLNHSRLKLDLHLQVLRSLRAQEKFCYALIDIDHFKEVNDKYGHFAGDIVIKTLSHLLQQRLRATDIVGRYGGEEFGVILPNTPAKDALTVLNEIHAKFRDIKFMANGIPFYVTFSGGIAEFPTYHSADEMNMAADEALYKAKHLGRNRLIVAEKQEVVEV